MKIMLLNPPYKFKVSKESRWPEYTKSGTLYYPFWLAYAAGLILQESRHEVFLLDALARKLNFSETIERIKNFNPNLLVIETATPTFFNDVKFAEEVKKNLNTKIVFVGTHVSALPEESLKVSDAIDFIARREYEYTILDLADTLDKNRNLRKVLGISYRKDKKIIHNPDRPLIQNLDILPFVSKVYKKFLNIYDYRYALARYPMVQIWSSRGCPYRCTFCVYPQVFLSRRFRVRSPKNFVDELEWIKENLPQIKEIFFEDDTFTVDKRRVIKICELIKERNLDIVWSCNARADIPYEVLKKMKEAGCRMLIVGYEAGNQRILNNIRKGITIHQMIEFTRNTKRLGIKIFGCFMLGLPGETGKTLKQTFELAKKLLPDMVFFQQAVPFPGTEFYEWAKNNGYLITEDYSKWLDESGRLNFLVSYPKLPREKIANLREKFMLNYYLNPKMIFYSFLTNLYSDEFLRVLNYAKEYFLFLFQTKISRKRE